MVWIDQTLSHCSELYCSIKVCLFPHHWSRLSVIQLQISFKLLHTGHSHRSTKVIHIVPQRPFTLFRKGHLYWALQRSLYWVPPQSFLQFLWVLPPLVTNTQEVKLVPSRSFPRFHSAPAATRHSHIFSITPRSASSEKKLGYKG